MAVVPEKTIIGLSDGHGMGTPGKRTPKFTDGTKSPDTGKDFMHENEFNRAVVKLVDADLRRHGFKTLLVAPTDADTPLETRVALAASKGADIYVSVHANAMTGVWGKARGIETFHHTESKNGTRLAKLVHRELVKGTKLVDRGLKNGNHLYEIRKTAMPAVLVECGFMDNLEEAKLLLSTHYRKECAEEIVRGVLAYYGVAYKGDAKDETKPSSNAKIDITKGIGTVKVKASELSFRETPALSGKLIRQLKKDEIYYVYEKRGMWYNLGGGWASEGSSQQYLSYIPHPKSLYYVRKSFADEASQKGAFYDLENAKSFAQEEGLSVFDESGKLIFKAEEPKPEPKPEPEPKPKPAEPTKEERIAAILETVPEWSRKHLSIALEAELSQGERLDDAPTRLELLVILGRLLEYLDKK